MIRRRLNVWTSVLPLVFLGYTTNSAAQALFEDREILDVRIEAPLTTFSRVRSGVEYLYGTFAFTDEMGAARSISSSALVADFDETRRPAIFRLSG